MNLEERNLALPNRRSPQDYLLFAEGMILIVVLALVIRFLPFSRIRTFASLPLRKKGVDGVAKETLLRQVRWAVMAAARRSPLRAECFEKGLTAQIMLRRRGVDSSLFYGLASGETEPLAAHVWVEAGDTAVCGTANSGDFAKLLRLPVETNGGEISKLQNFN